MFLFVSAFIVHSQKNTRRRHASDVRHSPVAHFKIKRGRLAACQCWNQTDVVPGGGTAESAHSADERPDDADANERRQHECGERRSTVPNSRVSP